LPADKGAAQTHQSNTRSAAAPTELRPATWPAPDGPWAGMRRAAEPRPARSSVRPAVAGRAGRLRRGDHLARAAVHSGEAHPGEPSRTLAVPNLRRSGPRVPRPPASTRRSAWGVAAHGSAVRVVV